MITLLAVSTFRYIWHCVRNQVLIAIETPDDSVEMHSSPIRGHADRKLSRTASLSTPTGSIRPGGLQRAPSDEFADAVQTAFGNIDGVSSLDAEQLVKLRAMIAAVSGKLDQAIEGGPSNA